VLALARVGSTNDLARRIVASWGRKRPFPGLAVVAGEQTAGRGRLGRAWASPAGRGVYLSVIRGLPSEVPAGLSLLAGAAVCAVLRGRCELQAGLEWPNDVLVGGRKICGVLVEVVGVGGPAPVAIVGLGLNVTHRREDLPRADATSVLLETGRSVAPASLVPELVAAVDDELLSGRRPGYAVGRFAELTVHRVGEPLSCREGDRTVRGLFDGLEASGALRLRVGGDVRILHAGELSGGEEETPC
jgi:BirA family biotin operon repressor/biotin-[acetyl-CoA-carboxylase] ligase